MIVNIDYLDGVKRSFFEDALAAYKELHDENVSMISAITKDMLRAIAVWPNVRVRMREHDVVDSEDSWSWVQYSSSEWQCLASVPGDRWVDVMVAVTGNHLVYPDGTLPQYIRALLVGRAREVLGIQ